MCEEAMSEKKKAKPRARSDARKLRIKPGKDYSRRNPSEGKHRAGKKEKYRETSTTRGHFPEALDAIEGSFMTGKKLRLRNTKTRRREGEESRKRKKESSKKKGGGSRKSAH